MFDLKEVARFLAGTEGGTVPSGEYDMYVGDLEDLEWATISWTKRRCALEVRKEMETGKCHDSGKRYVEFRVNARCNLGYDFGKTFTSSADFPSMKGKFEEIVKRDLERGFKRLKQWWSDPERNHDFHDSTGTAPKQLARVPSYGPMYERICPEFDPWYNRDAIKEGRKKGDNDDDGYRFEPYSPELASKEAYDQYIEVLTQKHRDSADWTKIQGNPQDPCRNIPTKNGPASLIKCFKYLNLHDLFEVVYFDHEAKEFKKAGQFIEHRHGQTEIIVEMIMEDFANSGKPQIYWEQDNPYGLACFRYEAKDPSKTYDPKKDVRFYGPKDPSEGPRFNLVGNDFLTKDVLRDETCIDILKGAF